MRLALIIPVPASAAKGIFVSPLSVGTGHSGYNQESCGSVSCLYGISSYNLPGRHAGPAETRQPPPRIEFRVVRPAGPEQASVTERRILGAESVIYSAKLTHKESIHMADILGSITNARSLLEKIASKIPGFGGYMEKETRRSADKLLRDTIVNRYGDQLSRVSALQAQLVQSGGIEFVDDLQGAATRLQRFIDTVKTAAYGYAGFFDPVKIKENELAKLYAFDNALLDNATKVTGLVDAVEAAVNGGEGLPAAIKALTDAVAECNTAFERRKEVLLS